MARTRGFDEVMIVNPSTPGHGVTHMRFHNAPEFGYYAEPYEYGYYAEPSEYGYYAEPMEYGYGWAQAPPEYGYFAEETPYGEADPYAGGWGEPTEFADWAGVGYGEVEPGYAEAEPVGYFAQESPAYAEQPYEGWAGPEDLSEYAEVPELVGWGEPEPLAEDAPAYAAQNFEGYVRDVPSPFNAGCPLPSNVSGFEEADPLAGYIKPETVNAACGAFIEQPGGTPSVPETFKPLW
jgi:hypothetical protein